MVFGILYFVDESSERDHLYVIYAVRLQLAPNSIFGESIYDGVGRRLSLRPNLPPLRVRLGLCLGGTVNIPYF